ncbi:hypothetical protein CBR_g21307 [Chara braunii]|uniref:Uncharacterized protein n=1 Tax=Chara braunii TaxID=69332 RepID=A0A388L192_CHABU|nr:hypothetical protein CBR_g21307 [Chara braunii]|eukprot:GBG76067.1 hypothetical protein CBR_g21307 [Chara braunii]
MNAAKVVFIRDCAEFWQVKALGRAFVPSAQTVNPTRTGRPAVTSTSIAAQRSRSAECGSERGETGDDTNALMSEYFLQMAEERRNRVEREAEEERRRKDEELRQERENKRLLCQEERQRLEAERDARLLRIIRSEMRKDRDEERESPPIVTTEKKSNMKLSGESMARIELLKSELGADAGTSCTPKKIDLSLKHIMASCGPGGKEKFEKECSDFYDALTTEELKEACRHEKVAYGNRELAIKRLVIRRSSVAYDPSVIPLPLHGCRQGALKASRSRKSRKKGGRIILTPGNRTLTRNLSEVLVVATTIWRWSNGFVIVDYIIRIQGENDDFQGRP